MNISELSKALDLKPISVSDWDRDVVGAYSGDLLSWVMTRLSPDYAFITVMNNTNVIAVASLSDASCVILTENSEVPEDMIEKAISQNINLLKSDKSSFELSYQLGKLLYEK